MKKWLLVGTTALMLTACSTKAPSEPPSPPATTPLQTSSVAAKSALHEVLEETGFKQPPTTMTGLDWYKREADGSFKTITTSPGDKSIITAGGYEPRPNTRKVVSTPQGEKLWLNFYCTGKESTTGLSKPAIKEKIEHILSKMMEQKEKFEKNPKPQITMKGSRHAILNDYPGCKLDLQP